MVDGGVFFDMDPKLFTLVLKFLRLKRLCGASLAIGPPTLPSHCARAFDRLIDYLGMQEYWPRRQFDSEILSLANENALRELACAQSSQPPRLLFRASRDGFGAPAFHSKCDGVAHTIVIARSAGGFVFGGYSGSAPWSSVGNFTASEGAFLFRLDGPGVQGPSKHGVLQNHANAIYCHAGYGPTFGGGHDLHIQNSPGTSVQVNLNLGHTYNPAPAGGGGQLTHLAEGNPTTITDWEVFSIS